MAKENGFTYEEIEEQLDKVMEADGDDDILSEIENENKIKAKKTKAKKAPKKKEPFKLSKQTIGTLIFFATAVVIGFVCYDLNNLRLARIAANTPEVEEQLYIESNPYSKENVKAMIDEDMLGTYRYLLYGEYHAANAKSPTGEVEFTFGQDNSFFGYSSSERDDFGTYDLAATTDGVILTITCTSVVDTYRVDISESGNIVLTDPNNNVFSLYEA